jgi:hypothetical protein
MPKIGGIMLSLKQYIVEGNPLARLHKHAQEGRHYAVISAHRPEGEATPEQNKANHAELKKKLTAQGYAHKEVEGHWEGGKEKSILVHAKGKGTEHGKQLLHDVKEHGKSYNQDSVFHHDTESAKLHGTNETGFPGKGKTKPVGQTRYNKPDSPYQTEMKPKSDKPLKKGRTDKGSARFTTASKFGG